MSDPVLNEKLKVAVLIRHYNPSGGGAERYCVELTEQLAQQHKVHLFSQSVAKHSPNVTVHQIPQWLKRPRYINQLLFSWFTRRATEGKFDIVHSHDTVTHANIYTLHVPCVRTRWTEARGIRMIVRWLNTLISPRKITYLWLEKIQMRPAPGKRLITVSEFLNRNIEFNYPKATQLTSIAYPGIHPNPSFIKERDPSWRKEQQIPNNAFLALAVANDFKKKGVQKIIDALEIANLTELHLVVAGGGKKSLLQIPDTIRSKIHFLGSVRDMEHLYSQADLLIHPTLVDTYGMVALEAMAHQLPIIISSKKFCGFSEHLSNEEALLLEDPESAAEIAEKICFLFNHPEDRFKIAQTAWKKSQTITWENCAIATQHAYQQVLTSRTTL